LPIVYNNVSVSLYNLNGEA